MNSLKIITTVVFLFIAAVVYPQGLTLKGHISDKQGNNLFAVNVYLQKQTSVGTTSDFDGNFILKIPNSINLKNECLVVSFIGYNQLKLSFDSIDLFSSFNIILRSNPQTLNEVVVKGRKSISKEFSIKELTKLKIYLSPLSSADPLKALAMLPSSTNTDETANPELRGSDANRTKIFINGVPISNPVRNSQLNGIGFFSLLNTEMMMNEFIYPTNPPLIYGNTSAGLIDIETENVLESNHYQLSLTLANSGVNISQRINPKSFIQVYSNFMYSNLFLSVNPLLNKRLKGFSSNDFGLNYHNEISERFSINFYNYLLSEDSNYLLNLFTWEGNAKAETIRDFSIMNFKYHRSGNYLGINIGSNVQRSKFTFGNINSASKQNQLYASINFKHLFSEKMSVQTGVTNDYMNICFKDVVPEFYYAMSPSSPSMQSDTSLRNHLPEGYIYFRWNPLHKIIWGVGVRKNFDISRRNNANYLSVQTSLRYNFRTDNSLILSIGKYHNYSEPNYGQKEFRLLSSKHYALEYIYEKKRTTINLAAYYKIENGDLAGTKRIKGVEVFLEQDLLKNFKLSISNAILNSDVSFQDKVYNVDNSVGYFLVTTFSYFSNKFVNVSASLSNRQGKLFTPVNSSIYNPAVNFYEPIYSSSINSNQLKNYSTINISMSKMFSMAKRNLITFVSVNNLLNTKNQRSLIYSADYSASTYDYYQRRTFYFGFVISFE